MQLLESTLNMAQFETSFETSIPCKVCNQPARFRSFGHQFNDCGFPDENGNRPPFYRCTECYVQWRCENQQILARYHAIYCHDCGRACYTCEELSDYREF